MGTFNHPFLSIAGADNNQNQEKKPEQKSPYLKAILSAQRADNFIVRNISSVNDSDRSAASRYIKESSCLRKV